MPLYDFACRKCNRVFEALLPTSRALPPPCPECGADKPVRQLSVFAAASGRSGEFAACSTCPDYSSRSPCASGVCPMR